MDKGFWAGAKKSWRYLRANPFFAVVFVLLAALLFLVLVGPVFYEGNPNQQNLSSRLRPPGSRIGETTLLLGSDQLGRDMLGRLMFGGRVTLAMSSAAVLLATLLGVGLGIWAGFARGVIDSLVVNIMNIQLSVPTLILAITLAGTLGRSWQNLVLVLAVTSWVPIGRIVRAETLAAASQEYVEAARSTGASSLHIMRQHILPNVSSSIFVVVSLQLARVILAETSLAFLGLGDPSMPSWGAMLADARVYMVVAWWTAVLPGLGTFLLVLGANIVGDFLRDVLDPKLTTRR